MQRRSWTGVPATLPRRLPTPIPEIAYLIRMAIELMHLPGSPRRDYIINYLRHVSILRRFPKRQLFFNDVLFQIKVGPVLRSPLAVYVSDKEFVKRHIAQVVGDQYNIPTLALLKTAEEVDAYEFPEKCVIKPTHASAEYIARKAGEPIDLKRIKAWLKLDFYEKSFEPNYRGLQPKIIVEPWVFDRVETMELKVMCVAGRPRAINAIADRFADYSVMSFDPEWNETPYRSFLPAKYKKFEKPKHLAEILSLAKRLSKDFFFTRIDFYYDGETIRCGEITNCSAAGLDNYKPFEGELVHSRQLFSDAPPAACEEFFNLV